MQIVSVRFLQNVRCISTSPIKKKNRYPSESENHIYHSDVRSPVVILIYIYINNIYIYIYIYIYIEKYNIRTHIFI